MSLSSWDDFPVHQTSEFIRHPATSDRNFYDRYYFNMHPSNDRLFAIFGFGQYPNLGVTDAFIAVRHEQTQHIVRASAELDDRMHTQVGPIRVEIIEPLKKLRVVVEPSEHSVEMDVTWEGAMPAHEEPRQYLRKKGKVVFDTQRFCQTGNWSGSIAIAGETYEVTPDTWRGVRDRSWGVRPVGEKEPDGIRADINVMSGMWNYFPMQFDDHTILYICNEEDDGVRPLEEATRVWHSDGRVEWLGTPEWHHDTISGTRVLSGSTVTFPDAPEGPIDVRCTPILANWVSVGTGYGIDPDWRHGMYQGPEVVQGLQLDCDEIKGLAQYGIVDHIGRFEYNNNTGYGLYEHGFFGEFNKLGLSDRGALFD
jgi:hypothetical protein